MSDAPRLITGQAELSSLCRRLADSGFVAIDTEFIRERTYYPRLCLIQIASDTEIALIDVLARLELDELFSTLRHGRLVKVLHAARQDLEIFYHHCESVPAPVFDTQLAAACMGMGEQLSYSRLVEMLFEVPPGKSHARTDWSRRPLSAQQIEYAVADVRYLVPAYHELCRRLEQAGRMEWLHEACDRLIDSGLYAPDPELAYRRVRGAGRLGATQQARLRRLASWREQVAMRADRPRRWILDDRVLIALTRLDGSDRDALARTPGLPPAVFRRHGNRLREILRAGAAEKRHAREAVEPRLGAGQSKLLKRLSGLVREEAQRLGTSPSILATRTDLAHLIDRPDECQRLTSGWRREVIGERLLAAISSANL